MIPWILVYAPCAFVQFRGLSLLCSCLPPFWCLLDPAQATVNLFNCASDLYSRYSWGDIFAKIIRRENLIFSLQLMRQAKETRTLFTANWHSIGKTQKLIAAKINSFTVFQNLWWHVEILKVGFKGDFIPFRLATLGALAHLKFSVLSFFGSWKFFLASWEGNGLWLFAMTLVPCPGHVSI